MTAVPKELLTQRKDALSLPVARWNKRQTEIVNAALASMQATIDQPELESVAWLVTGEDLNSLQVNSIRRLIERCKHAHYTDLVICINGKDEHYEADWIKHLKETP